MLIGFDGSRAFSKDRTGTENYSFQLLKALAEIDHKNQYIVYLRPGANVGIARSAALNFPRSSLRKFAHLDLRIPPSHDEFIWPENFQFKVIKWSWLWTQVGLAKQTFHDKLDVLFIPAHTSPLIHQPGLKTVVTVHDLGAEYLPKMHQIKQRLYLKWITNYQLKNATKLIVVSKATKDDLVKRIGIDQNRIHIVYESYNTDLTRSIGSDTLESSLKQYDLKPQEYYLFVGSIQPRKNLERLIKAFVSVIPSKEGIQLLDPRIREDDHLKLVIVGSKGWLSDEIYALPKKLGIEDRVKFLGRVDDAQLPALYSGAIALTFPSLFEGFGLPILEAQALGCPVITSNLSSMPEVAGKGAILVDPYSEKDILRGMREIGEIRGIREKLIKLGRENIKRFSWEK